MSAYEINYMKHEHNKEGIPIKQNAKPELWSGCDQCWPTPKIKKAIYLIETGLFNDYVRMFVCHRFEENSVYKVGANWKKKK